MKGISGADDQQNDDFYDKIRIIPRLVLKASLIEKTYQLNQKLKKIQKMVINHL